MSDEKATKALVALIKELCSLVPKEKMPIIHIGTDEVRGKDEQVNNEILKEYIHAVGVLRPHSHEMAARPDAEGL